jgi:hypothetical protein
VEIGGVIVATYKDFELAVALLSGGTNTVIYDDVGLPSIMVRFDKKLISELIDGGSNGPHPAFLVEGVEVPAFYCSKYQNIVYKGRAYSLPLQDPATYYIDASDRGSAPSTGVNFDNSKIWCEAKGPGWHLMTNAEWAAIALWCRKNGFMPRGNNNYGKDHSAQWEQGIETYGGGDPYRTYRVATGSGPVSWSHDGTPAGIWDLNGNVWEWVGGYRTVDGEIQIIPDNIAAKQIEQTSASSRWKAILPDGSLVEPGTPGTLKWDFLTKPSGSSGFQFQLVTTITNRPDDDLSYGSNSFAALTAASGVTVPEILKSLALFPADSGDHGGDYIFMRNRGERLGYRGGDWSNGARAGVFYLNGSYSRSNVGVYLGFRSAYIPGI